MRPRGPHAGLHGESDLGRYRHRPLAQSVLAIGAGLFGVVTIIAGSRVLAGADPGYVVFRPLLLYNTVMGVAYVMAGVIAWRHRKFGKYSAGVIFLLNLLVLIAISYGYAAGSAIAVESVRAMTFRTLVWLLVFLGLAWVGWRSAPGAQRSV